MALIDDPKYQDPFYVLGEFMDAVARIEDPVQRVAIGEWLAEKYDREQEGAES